MQSRESAVAKVGRRDKQGDAMELTETRLEITNSGGLKKIVGIKITNN